MEGRQTPNQPEVLRYISWRDVCPWLLLTGSFRTSIGGTALLLSMIAIFLSSAGWRFSRTCFLSHVIQQDDNFAESRAIYEQWPGRKVAPNIFDQVGRLQRSHQMSLGRDASPMTDMFVRMSTPFCEIFRFNRGWGSTVYWAVGGTWNILVWSFFGLAIARIAAVRFSRDESVTLGEALDFARKNCLSCLGATLLPLTGIFAIALPLMMIGLIMRSDIGVVIAGLLWIFVIGGGFAMAILGIGLLFGWPLMWGTMASESSDAFDAISRSYSYTFQKPLHFLFFFAVASLLGIVGWIGVWLIVECVTTLTSWAVVIGTGSQRWEAELGNVLQGIGEAPVSRRVGMWLIDVVNTILRAFLSAYSASYFWAAMTGIYLLLRLHTDHTELDDIHFDQDDESAFGLPEFDRDEAGVPVVRRT